MHIMCHKCKGSFAKPLQKWCGQPWLAPWVSSTVCVYVDVSSCPAGPSCHRAWAGDLEQRKKKKNSNKSSSNSNTNNDTAR
eukprot:494632-Karenia_brevis.AAC.2